MDVLVGRGPEQAALESALDKLRFRRGGALVIAGEAGLGKTSLLNLLCASARENGVRVVRSRAWEVGGAPAYAEWSQLLRQLVAHDSGVLAAATSETGRAVIETLVRGGSAPGVAEADRFAFFTAVWDVLQRAARDDGLVVVLDDMHAAGTPSVALLEHVARETGDAAVLLVVAYRDVEARLRPGLDAALMDLRTTATCLDLGPLAREACDALVRSVPGTEDAVVGRVHAATGGNPYWALELARLLAARRHGDSAAALLVPSGVRAVVRSRLQLLPEYVGPVLGAAAVLGQEFDVHRLTDVVGADAAHVADALDAAARAGLVLPASSAGTRLAFAHAILRETVDADLPPATRRQLHLAAAQTLGDAPAPDHLSERAHHLVAAGVLSPWQDTVAALCDAADRSLQVLAADAALADFTTALELLPADAGAALRLRVLLGVASAHVSGGDQSIGRTFFRQAFELAREAGDVDAMVEAVLGAGRLVNDMFVTDQWLVDALRELLRGDLPHDLAVRLLARLSTELQPGPERTATAAEAERLLVDVRDPVTRWDVLRTLGEVALPDPVVDRRMAWSTELVRIAERLGPLHRAGAYGSLGVARLWAGDVAGAQAAMRLRAEYAARTGQPYALAQSAMHDAVFAVLLGRWSDAEEPLARVLELGWGRARRVASLAAWMVCEWQRLEAVGPEEALRAHVELCIALCPPEIPNFLVVRPLLRAAGGDGLEALREEVDRQTATRFAAIPRNGSWAFVVAVVAEGAWWLRSSTAGHVCKELLEPHAGTLMVAGQSTVAGVAVGPADRYRALAVAATGDLDGAVDLLDRAEAAARAWGTPPALARVLADRATVRSERGARGDAEATVRDHRDALELARRLGMARFVELLERWGVGTPGHAVPAPGVGDPTGSGPGEVVLRPEGEMWAIEHRGRTSRLRDSRGVRYLACLLDHPGRELAAVDLAGRSVIEPDVGPLADETAMRAYRARIRALQQELDDADVSGDAERSARVRDELDELVRHLGAVTGLGGRRRRTGGADERARSAVTKATREAIARIGSLDETLGAHLQATIRTGRHCVYRPELGPHVRWTVATKDV